jgi:biotin synthase
MINKEIFLCAINNIQSGSCSEDCKFCTQSVKYKTNIQTYNLKNSDLILEEAKQAKKNGALGFCLVSSGKSMSQKTLKQVIKSAEKIKNNIENLNLIACNGTATKSQLAELKKAGIDSYNHNLETAKSFYPDICTTHSWQERYQTCENILESDLKLCTGGIFGMGENQEQREEFIETLSHLNPDSVPMNFYHQNPNLPIKNNNLESIDQGLELISKMRKKLGDSKRIMVAGGRESFFKNRQSEIFNAGANSIVIGNYLTTAGQEQNKDIQMIQNLNLKIAKKC